MTSLGVTIAVVDSMIVDPCDVTVDDSTVVVTDGSALVDAVVVDGAADEVVDTELDVEDTPVDRLTCRFSSFASATSISLAGTADAEIMAKRRTVENDHGCILEIVFKEIGLVLCAESVENTKGDRENACAVVDR